MSFSCVDAIKVDNVSHQTLRSARGMGIKLWRICSSILRSSGASACVDAAVNDACMRRPPTCTHSGRLNHPTQTTHVARDSPADEREDSSAPGGRPAGEALYNNNSQRSMTDDAVRQRRTRDPPPRVLATATHARASERHTRRVFMLDKCPAHT